MVQIINGDNSLGNSQTAKIVYNRGLLNRNVTFAFFDELLHTLYLQYVINYMNII